MKESAPVEAQEKSDHNILGFAIKVEINIGSNLNLVNFSTVLPVILH